MSSEALEDKKHQDTADVKMKDGQKLVEKVQDKKNGKEGKEVEAEAGAEADAEEGGKEGEEEEKEGGDGEMVEAEQEKEPEEKAEDDSKDEAEKGKKVKRGRRGSSKKAGKVSAADNKDKDEGSNEPVTPNERPTRERKTVKRYSVPSSGRSASKGLSIEKGRGTQLRDIPNVAYKLSRRKPDDNLQILHTILFGKKTKSHSLKKNISQFSGYVWIENEEKQRARIKEKLVKCVKEKLLDFCDILNIPITKTAVKKEELSLKLLEFLESPHATTDVLLADKEQRGKKRKAKGTTKSQDSGALAGRPAKKRKETLAGDMHKHTSAMEEEDDKAEPSDNKYDSEDDDKEIPEKESDEEGQSEEEEREDEEEKSKQMPSEKKSTKKTLKESGGKVSGKSKLDKENITRKSPKSPSKQTKKSSSSATKKQASDAGGASGSASKPKVSATKNKKVEKEREDKRTSTKEKRTRNKKQSSKSSSNIVAKELGKGKASKKAKAEPSKEEIHSVVVDILNEVDFNTATLSDIIKILGNHFDVDLMHRKAEVKAIITDVINNMSDEEDEAESGDEDEKDEDGDSEN